MASVRPIASHPEADSYWAATATPMDPFPALQQTVHCDVLIVGSGYTGLATALHLARTGTQVHVLDAHQPGWGASGRNGGQVNPTLKYDPDDLVRMFGDRSELLIETIAHSADTVFDLIHTHGIDCLPVRGGWVQAGQSDKSAAVFRSRAAQWQRRGYPVELLDAAALRSHTGSGAFRVGWLDKRAGSVQPLSYARGLARAAATAGAVIHGDTIVTKLQRLDQRWSVETARGVRASADQLILATNAYSDGLWPGLASSVLSANSFMVATEPLGDRAAHVLPLGQTLATAQRLLIYMRKQPDGRILVGGRGLFEDPSSPEDFAHIERSLKILYPELGPVRFDYHWAGRVAITRDFMPHVHQPAPGLTVALGYNGRGVAAASVMGQALAAMITGGAERDFPFPITRLSQIPLHGALQRFYISAGVAWYGLLDRLSS